MEMHLFINLNYLLQKKTQQKILKVKNNLANGGKQYLIKKDVMYVNLLKIMKILLEQNLLLEENFMNH